MSEGTYRFCANTYAIDSRNIGDHASLVELDQLVTATIHTLINRSQGVLTEQNVDVGHWVGVLQALRGVALSARITAEFAGVQPERYRSLAKGPK